MSGSKRGGEQYGLSRPSIFAGCWESGAATAFSESARSPAVHVDPEVGVPGKTYFCPSGVAAVNSRAAGPDSINHAPATRCSCRGKRARRYDGVPDVVPPPSAVDSSVRNWSISIPQFETRPGRRPRADRRCGTPRRGSPVATRRVLPRLPYRSVIAGGRPRRFKCSPARQPSPLAAYFSSDPVVWPCARAPAA